MLPENSVTSQDIILGGFDLGSTRTRIIDRAFYSAIWEIFET
jgi:hypothetical protein